MIIKSFFISLLNRFVGLLLVIFGIGIFFFSIICVIFLLITVVVGAWDLLVWLTKSDWRTTNFSVPIIGGIISIAAFLLNRAVLLPIFEKWLSPLSDWSENNINILNKSVSERVWSSVEKIVFIIIFVPILFVSGYFLFTL